MKPLKLELQAFGPYVEKQIIDFEKLSEKGMFLIKGKGKHLFVKDQDE